MRIVEPLEIVEKPGRWRLTTRSDECSGIDPLCECRGGHESPEAARVCPVAAKAAGDPLRPALPGGDLARIAYEAYAASTGGKTWDGRPMPTFAQIREKTPHVALAWEAAVNAALKASRP